MAALNDSVLKPAKELTAVVLAVNTENESEAIVAVAGQPFSMVQVYTTGVVHIAAPTKVSYVAGDATTTKSMPIPAGMPMVFKVPTGHKLRMISGVASTVFMTVME